jgi:hypothetical protein
MSAMEHISRLRSRLETALEWYQGCDAVPETLRNVQRDLDSLWRETRPNLPLKLQSYRLRALFDGDAIVALIEPFDAVRAVS